MSQVQDFISMALLTALIAFNPWLILLLVLAIIPSF
jgi:ATP-binding cassette subfamily B protein